MAPRLLLPVWGELVTFANVSMVEVLRCDGDGSMTMKTEGQLLPEQSHVPGVRANMPLTPSAHVVFTRDHDVIRQWAEKRQAQPATGEATSSGPATVDVKDGGAGVRFNFPGTGLYRPIPWDEWFENFDHHECAFVYDNDSVTPPSNRYRIVKAAEWKDMLG